MARALPRLRSARKPCDTLGVSVVNKLNSGLRPLLDLVYPPTCPSCGVAIAEHGGICSTCWNGLEVPSEDTQVIAPYIYNEISRELVLKLKHGGKFSLAALMGRMMATALENGATDENRLLVPVPLHRLRIWERGYNQAALLATELAKHGKGQVCLNALKRRKRTPSLGGLGRSERQRVLSGAITVNAACREKLSGRKIVLVDDVYTSGATSSACTSALLEAGAKSVKVLCFARVETD